jgi:hypothetical protein
MLNRYRIQIVNYADGFCSGKSFLRFHVLAAKILRKIQIGIELEIPLNALLISDKKLLFSFDCF